MKKIDGSHAMIVQGLRALGAFVQSIASVGKGCPDLLVGYRGAWFVAEVKDGAKSASRRRLTVAEQVWHEQVGNKAPVHIWGSLEDAIDTITSV